MAIALIAYGEPLTAGLRGELQSAGTVIPCPIGQLGLKREHRLCITSRYGLFVGGARFTVIFMTTNTKHTVKIVSLSFPFGWAVCFDASIIFSFMWGNIYLLIDYFHDIGILIVVYL